MDSNSDSCTISSSSVEINSDSNTYKLSASNSFENVNKLTSNINRNNLFVLDEDHFSINSEIDYLNDVEYSVIIVLFCFILF